jgi:hypothetical protein
MDRVSLSGFPALPDVLLVNCFRIAKNELDFTLASRKGSLVYRVPEFRCWMIWGVTAPPFPSEMAPPSLSFYSESVFVNVYGTLESIPPAYEA